MWSNPPSKTRATPGNDVDKNEEEDPRKARKEQLQKAISTFAADSQDSFVLEMRAELEVIKQEEKAAKPIYLQAQQTGNSLSKKYKAVENAKARLIKFQENQKELAEKVKNDEANIAKLDVEIKALEQELLTTKERDPSNQFSCAAKTLIPGGLPQALTESAPWKLVMESFQKAVEGMQNLIDASLEQGKVDKEKEIKSQESRPTDMEVDKSKDAIIMDESAKHWYTGLGEKELDQFPEKIRELIKHSCEPKPASSSAAPLLG